VLADFVLIKNMEKKTIADIPEIIEKLNTGKKSEVKHYLDINDFSEIGGGVVKAVNDCRKAINMFDRVSGNEEREALVDILESKL